MRAGLKRYATAVGAISALAVALAGCGGGGKTEESSDTLAGIKTDKSLHAQLSDDIKQSGEITSVMSGAFPPYTIPEEGGTGFEGASIELGDALGKVLGVKVTTKPVEGLSGLLNGLGSGRYDFAMGPVGDYDDRQGTVDFVDWVQEFVAFLTADGNPKGIKSLEDTCGLRVSVQAGGSAEDVIRQQSKKCQSDGQKPIEVQALPDQPAAVLAVRAGRSDAFFSSQAPLVYFQSQNTDDLMVAAKGKPNGFDPIRQGSVFPEDSKLQKVVYDAFAQLQEEGVYQKIMAKWGLQDQVLDELTVNRKPAQS